MRAPRRAAHRTIRAVPLLEPAPLISILSIFFSPFFVGPHEAHGRRVRQAWRGLHRARPAQVSTKEREYEKAGANRAGVSPSVFFFVVLSLHLHHPFSLSRRVTFLLGPHASPHFFKANDDEMSQKEVYEFNVPTFGPGVVFDVDHKTRAEQFRFFGAALKSSRLAAYVPQFVAEARAYFAGWGDEGVVDLKDALAELIILTASRTLMGEFSFSFFQRVFSTS